MGRLGTQRVKFLFEIFTLTSSGWVNNHSSMDTIRPLSISEVIRAIEARVPLGTAEEWDNVGLLVGDPTQISTGAVISIDLTSEAIDLAVKNKYNLILNHHPCIFPKSRGLRQVVAGSQVFDAIQKGIAVAAFHTNFDQCALEVVHEISKGLQIAPKGRLLEKTAHPLMKLVTFIPESHVAQVRSAICEAGAGHIGNYDSCTFRTQGEGSFRGGETTRPFLGESGKTEFVQEIRLETIFPRGLKSSVVAALRAAHPYEEVAYDLYPVSQSTSNLGLHAGLGYGFWGEFQNPKLFLDLAEEVKSLFNINGFWITDPIPTSVKRVGFVAGKGASFLEAAISMKCDLFITGEAGYHPGLESSRRGMAVMELGHRESEKFFVETMKSWLKPLGMEYVEALTPTQTFCSGGKK